MTRNQSYHVFIENIYCSLVESIFLKKRKERKIPQENLKNKIIEFHLEGKS